VDYYLSMKKDEIENIINKYKSEKEQNRASHRRMKKRIEEDKKRIYIDNRPKFWKEVKADKSWVELEFCPDDCKSSKGDLKKFFRNEKYAEMNCLPNQTIYMCSNSQGIEGYHITSKIKP